MHLSVWLGGRYLLRNDWLRPPVHWLAWPCLFLLGWLACDSLELVGWAMPLSDRLDGSAWPSLAGWPLPLADCLAAQCLFLIACGALPLSDRLAWQGLCLIGWLDDSCPSLAAGGLDLSPIG